MAMETDPAKINDMDRQLKQSIFTEGQSYAARNSRSKEENKGRAASRERIKNLGMVPQAFGQAVLVVKTKTPGEIDDYLRDFLLSIEVLRQQQADLFPEELAAALKREQLRVQKAAAIPRTQEELDAASDGNARSAPDAGGAKPRTGRAKPTVVAGTDTLPPPVPGEQAEGEAALAAGLPETAAAGAKKSQSQIAQEKLDAAMSPGKAH